MRLLITAAALAALAFASTADAASTCKDAKGKYIKCPAPAAAPASTKTGQCKDSKGHFIKCPTTSTTSMTTTSPTKTTTTTKTTSPTKTTTTTQTTTTPGTVKCKTGVPCGKSCIPKGKVCHK